MTWKLFLDDLRNVEEIWSAEQVPTFIVARSFDEALTLIGLHGAPSYISFDNDLGDGELEGYDVAKQLVELDMDGEIRIPDNFQFFVHSANCKAWENIEAYLTNYLKQR